jgi:hypothetical protein
MASDHNILWSLPKAKGRKEVALPCGRNVSLDYPATHIVRKWLRGVKGFVASSELRIAACGHHRTWWQSEPWAVDISGLGQKVCAVKLSTRIRDFFLSADAAAARQARATCYFPIVNVPVQTQSEPPSSRSVPEQVPEPLMPLCFPVPLTISHLFIAVFFAGSPFPS